MAVKTRAALRAAPGARSNAQGAAALALALAFAAGAVGVASPAQAQVSLRIVTDSCPPVDALAAVGGFSTIDTFNSLTATPTLADLQSYDVVLAFSNDVPADPAGLGDVLADYVDGGGCLTLATYLFSEDWSVDGRILDPGYAPFKKTLADNYATASGSLVASLTGDPIFAGVNLPALTYQGNQNMADGTLDPGATLLATDGFGLNMIARAATRPITAINILPDGTSVANPGCTAQNNNTEFYRLLANSLLTCGLVFADGFELHGTSRWSATVP